MFKKILILAGAFIVLLFIGLSVFIKYFLTPDKVKSFLLPEAEQTLNRKVDLSTIQISLFRGIQVKDFVIKEADGKTDFITSKDFVFTFKILPLLSKKLVVEELRLVSPQIRIMKFPDGTYNFNTIGSKKPDTETPAQKTAQDADELPVTLLVDTISVEGAQFSFTDMSGTLPDMQGSLDVRSDVQSADTSGLTTSGTITLLLQEMMLKGPPQKQVRNISAGLDYQVMVDLKNKSVSMKKADLKVQKVSLSLTGEITYGKNVPVIDLHLSVPKTETADILESIAPFIGSPGLKPSGDITANLQVAGTPSQPDSLQTNGEVKLGQFGIIHKDLRTVLDGDLNIQGQKIGINTVLTSGENTADLKGTIDSFLKNQDIRLSLYAKKLSLDELIPVGSDSPSSAGSPITREKPEKEEPKPLNLKLRAGGEIRIDSANYGSMKMTDFHTKYLFRNNTLKVTELTANAGKGKLSLVSSLDLGKPGYTYDVSGKLDSLHADEVVNSLFPKARDTVFGILTVNLDLSGSGTLVENVRNNLKGKGDFTIQDGKITDSKIPENLAAFLGVQELRTINFTEAQGTVRIADSVANLESIFSSDDLSMDPKGKIGLDQTLALAFDLKLSPRLTERATFKSGIAQYIQDEKGWGRIPMIISGTFSSPSYSVDVAKAGKRVIRKKTDELLRDILEKDSTKQEGQEGGKKDKPGPIQDLLKGILD